MRRRTTRTHPLNYIQAKTVVEAFQYKPDWEISLKPAWYTESVFARNSVRLEVRFTAIDSTDPDQERDTDVLFDVTFDLDLMPGEDALVDFVRQTITQAEMHERDEWLRYKGELLDDPHRPGRDGRIAIEVA